MKLDSDAERILEEFLRGEINPDQLREYTTHDVPENLLEDLLIKPLKSKYKFIWARGRKKKNVRRVKKKAAYIVKHFADYSCILQRLTTSKETELDSQTVVTALNAVGCKAWPICFMN